MMTSFTVKSLHFAGGTNFSRFDVPVEHKNSKIIKYKCIQGRFKVKSYIIGYSGEINR